jgi:hypothetical protein
VTGEKEDSIPRPLENGDDGLAGKSAVTQHEEVEARGEGGVASKPKTPSRVVKEELYSPERNVVGADIGKTLKTVDKKTSRGTQTYSMIDRLLVAANITSSSIEDLERKLDLEPVPLMSSSSQEGVDQNVQVGTVVMVLLYFFFFF